MYDTGQASSGTLAIIVPLYGHAALVAEAIHSARRSLPFGLNLQTIVSVDGDPQIDVFDVLTCEAANDASLHVIFSENGGPGAARNRAIDFALDCFPDLTAVYFLDADNRVLPSTLRKLWSHKRETDADWVFTNVDAFGVNWTGHYGDRYSRLSHCITDNVCDTGSLVDVRVFHAGIRFDEDRQNGFEDWDFWLSCIKAGFTGSRCPGAAFEYRVRAESRFKEANRNRAGSLQLLRKRHKALYRRDRMVSFEHEEAPRYAVILADSGELRLLTDPRAEPEILEFADGVRRYWAARAEPDNHHFPPFILCCTLGTLALLQKSQLMPTTLSHIEEILENTNVGFVDLINDRDNISISAEHHGSGFIPSRSAVLVSIRTRLLDDVLATDGFEWLRSLAAPQVWPTSATLTLRFPLDPPRRNARFAPATQGLVNFAENVRSSVFRKNGATRWTWRKAMLSPGRELHMDVRRELGGMPVLPLGVQPAGRRTAAILTPIASFGGAEKVAYAAGRALKEAGYEVHVFVLGSSSMAILDAFDPYIDFVHIWENLPKWGSDRLFAGHDFIEDSPHVNWSLLKGQLSGFDLVVNNHVMAAHPVMSWLRSAGTRTVCYLHVVDHTPLGRPVGQPYAGIAFEHAYDAFVACSDALKRYLISFGVCGAKIFTVVNGPGFSLAPEALATARALRKDRPAGPLRLLYIGRLDVQKGIDRLHAVLESLSDAAIPYTARVVGAELIKDSRRAWTTRLAKYAEVLPPVYRTANIVSHLQWSDATLVPSRWEGAPLVVREAQYVGSIPIAADVGAVSEQITSGLDGLIAFGATDQDIVKSFVEHVRMLSNSERRQGLVDGCITTADVCDWEHAFGPFISWATAEPRR